MALTGDFYGDDCPDTRAVRPSRYVGLGYVDITGRHSVVPPGPLDPFFQLEREEISASQWEAGDPRNHVSANPGLQTLFVHAGDDELTSLEAPEEMIAALSEVGVAAELVVIPGIGHFDLGDVAHTGEAVADWLVATTG